MLLKKSVLEEIGGYDRDLGYGEDTDLVKRLQGKNLKQGKVQATEYHTLVTSLRDVYRQGRWYGKSMPQFFRKHPEESLSLMSMLFFLALPITTALAFLHIIFAPIAILQYAVLISYMISAYLRLQTFYVVGVPVIKIVRSYAEAVGVLRGLITEDIGRE